MTTAFLPATLSVPGLNVIKEDITNVHSDIIVNAANTYLAEGDGVCGAIFRGAGPNLAQFIEQVWRPLLPLNPGIVVKTPGFGLPAATILHAIGPIWHGYGNEDLLLQKTYHHAMVEAGYDGDIRPPGDNHVTTIAFPLISVGIYGFPLERGIAIAVKELREQASLQGICAIICVLTDEMFDAVMTEIEYQEVHNTELQRKTIEDEFLRTAVGHAE